MMTKNALYNAYNAHTQYLEMRKKQRKTELNVQKIPENTMWNNKKHRMHSSFFVAHTKHFVRTFLLLLLLNILLLFGCEHRTEKKPNTREQKK